MAINTPELFHIEKYILTYMLQGEYAEIIVKPGYLKSMNKEFWTYYKEIDREDDILFYIDLHEVILHEYVFNPNKEKLPKKLLLQKGKS